MIYIGRPWWMIEMEFGSFSSYLKVCYQIYELSEDFENEVMDISTLPCDDIYCIFKYGHPAIQKGVDFRPEFLSRFGWPVDEFRQAEMAKGITEAAFRNICFYLQFALQSSSREHALRLVINWASKRSLGVGALLVMAHRIHEHGPASDIIDACAKYKFGFDQLGDLSVANAYQKVVSNTTYTCLYNDAVRADGAPRISGQDQLGDIDEVFAEEMIQIRESFEDDPMGQVIRAMNGEMTSRISKAIRNNLLDRLRKDRTYKKFLPNIRLSNVDPVDQINAKIDTEEHRLKRRYNEVCKQITDFCGRKDRLKNFLDIYHYYFRYIIEHKKIPTSEIAAEDLGITRNTITRFWQINRKQKWLTTESLK